MASSVYMMNRFTTFLLTLIFLFGASQPTHAQDQTLTYEKTRREAVANSYDLKIGALEIEIGSQRLEEARAMYYPSLSLRLTNEYLHDMDKTDDGFSSVGETIISGNESTYQHSLALAASYPLYDFGVRPLRYQIAEREVKIARHSQEQQLLDLKREVLDLYGKGLALYKKIETWAILLRQKNEVYLLTQRLVDAGTKGKIDLGNAAIMVAEAVQNLDSLRAEMEALLQRLAYFTGRQYESGNVRFSDFLNDGASLWRIPQAMDLPEIKAYENAVRNKKDEYEIASRHWLPTFNLYSSYRMYGNDPASFVDSVEDMRGKNSTIGVVMNMDIFNGFGDQAKAARLKTEIRKLETEKARRVAQAEQVIGTLCRQATLYENSQGNWAAYLDTLKEQGSMIDRLATQQVIDRVSLLQQQGDQLEKMLSLELRKIEQQANSLHLQLLADGTSQ